MSWKKKSDRYATLLFLMVITLLMDSDVHARRYFLMERPEVDFKLSFEFEKEERSGPNIDREDKTMTFSEGLDIRTGGWIYHPALLSYDLELLPQWEQMYEKVEPDQKNKSRNFLEGYLTEFTFLQFKPYTLKLFANRSRSTINSNFTQRSKNDVDTYGGSFFLKYPVLPTTLDYAHTKTTQTGFFDFDEESDKFQLLMRYDKHLGDSRLKASYKDTNTTTRGQRLGIMERKADLTNNYNIENNRTLHSNLGYRNTEGDFFKLTRYHVSENFRWKHRKNLDTNYNYRYNKNEFETTRSETQSLGFNLRHLLYENLTTSLSATGSKNQFSGEKELEYGGGLTFNYVRRIPWGKLNATVGHNYMITEESKKTGFINISDEAATLTLGSITLLKNKHIDIDSIEVRNVPRTIQFQKDVDYRVTEAGSLIRISCIPGGLLDTTLNCTAGAPVTVDYNYLSDPEFNFSTFSRNYGINLSLWSVWNVYYSFNRRTERFLSGTEPDELIDDEIHTVGTDITWKWSKTGFMYSDSKTTNLPTREWHVSETLTFRPLKTVFLNFSGRYGETDFMDTGKTETFSGMTSNIQMLTSKKSRIILKGFMNEISGDVENIVNSGVSAVFEVAYRRLRASVEYSFSNERDKNAEEEITNHYFLIEVKTLRF